MTFDEWLEQASESERRTASEYVHHYPVEIAIFEMSLDELEEKGMDAIPDQEDWPTKTVCGCEPVGQYEFGSEGHRPSDWEDISNATLTSDDLAKLLGHDIPE